MNIYTKQKETQKHRTQIYSYQKGEGREEGQIRCMVLTETDDYTQNR